MRNYLVGLCLLVVPFLSYASEEAIQKDKCSEAEMKQFETFLDGNKTTFKTKADELYSETDACSNIKYIKLVELIDSIIADATKKADMCASAVTFCKENQDPSKSYQELSTVLVPSCGIGSRFVISQRECGEYFN